MTDRVDVRTAIEADLGQINAIFNHYVRETHVSFDLEPWSDAKRSEWFAEHGSTGKHQVLVAAAQPEDLAVGYACSSRYSPKGAYETTVQTSIYLAPSATGRGIGTQLYDELFRRLEREDLHRAVAGIALPNPASVAVHERFRFRLVGTFTEQGRKFGKYWDVAHYEKRLGAQPSGG